MTALGKTMMFIQFGHFARSHVDRTHPPRDKGVRRRHHRGLSARAEHERHCPDCHDQGVVRVRTDDGAPHWTTCLTCGRSDQD